MLVVSICLAGISCRYDGRDNLVPKIKALLERNEAIAVCPEVLGGLPTPRIPSEIQPDGRVLNQQGDDVTEHFARGAEQAMTICRTHVCTGAILRDLEGTQSILWYKGCIYDGSFNGTLVPGNGIFAQKLLDAGIPVMSEEEYLTKAG